MSYMFNMFSSYFLLPLPIPLGAEAIGEALPMLPPLAQARLPLRPDTPRPSQRASPPVAHRLSAAQGYCFSRFHLSVLTISFSLSAGTAH